MQTLFTNLFSVFAGDQIVQISFSNQKTKGGPIEPATGVAMSRADAEALRDLLTQMLGGNANA